VIKNVYFSRHGKRIDRHAPRQWKNWHKRCERWYDPPIVESNIDELDEQAKTIPKLEAIYCSPFLRCVQTAHVYACRHECPIFIENGMGENLRQGWFERGGMEHEGVPNFPHCLWGASILKYTYYTIDTSHVSIYKGYKFPSRS
jgi:broad specificity phosphatase PhoE